MNYIYEEIKTPVKGCYDCIVVGGGPAGIGAALAAARSGASTLLIERFGFLGGMWTAGLVNPVFDYQNKKGIIREIQSDLESLGAWGGFGGMSFKYEYMKKLLDDKIQQANVSLLYDTRFSKVIKEGDNVTGVICDNVDGRNAYLAKIVIDCTGDAYVASDADAECLVGREPDGKVQSITLMFTIGNVNFKQEKRDELYNLMIYYLEKSNSDYTIPYDSPFIIQIPDSNTAVVQLTHMRDVNPLNSFETTKAEIEGRRQAIAAVEFWKKHIPQFKSVELIQTAPLLGVRESRRIIGEYTLTAQDLFEGKTFDDGICEVTFGMDIHQPDGTTQNCRSIKPYEIPYRCLIPKGINNLLVAGRCISGTHEAMSSYRVTGNCCAMGEMAGYAASKAAKCNMDLRDVIITKL